MKKILRYVYRYLSRKLSHKHYHFIKSLPYLRRKRRIDLSRLDFIRLSSLELAANEIYETGVKGSIAELGVYRGDFAIDINRVFPDRKFYLFDTFKGFDQRDAGTDLNNNFSAANQDFSNTSIEYVRSRMPCPDNCIFRKGYFPETAIGINDLFAFVSIDTDLYEPIYAGLCFFYPLLAKGGYIFVHDFNNDEYTGAREAVRKFCAEKNIGYSLIADVGGSAVICK